MALFLPPNVQPLEPAANLDTWNDQQLDAADGSKSNADYFKKPIGMENRNVELDYHQL